MKRLILRISVILIIFGISLCVLIFGLSKLPHSLEAGDIKKGDDGIYYKVLIDETKLQTGDKFLSYFYYGNFYYDQNRQWTKYYNSRIYYAKLTLYVDDTVVYEFGDFEIAHINCSVTFDSFGKVKYADNETVKCRETILVDLPELNNSGTIVYRMDYFDTNHSFVMNEELTFNYENNGGSIKISK